MVRDHLKHHTTALLKIITKLSGSASQPNGRLKALYAGLMASPEPKVDTLKNEAKWEMKLLMLRVNTALYNKTKVKGSPLYHG